MSAHQVDLAVRAPTPLYNDTEDAQMADSLQQPRPWTMKRNLSFVDNNTCEHDANSGTKPLTSPDDSQQSWDVEKTMVMMDKRYGTTFVEWIQREENLECTAAHLKGIIGEYDLRKTANGLRWIVSNWTIDNIALIVRLITAEWPLTQVAALATLVSNDWPLKPYTSRLVVCIVHDMPLEPAVEFLNVFTEAWSVDSTLELVADLADKLHWRPDYMRHFALRFVWVLRASRTMDEQEVARLQLFCFGIPPVTAAAAQHPAPPATHLHDCQQHAANAHPQHSMCRDDAYLATHNPAIRNTGAAPPRMESNSYDSFFPDAYDTRAQHHALHAAASASLMAGSANQTATTMAFANMHALHNVASTQENVGGLADLEEEIAAYAHGDCAAPAYENDMDTCTNRY